jgi:hypothetical protein
VQRKRKKRQRTHRSQALQQLRVEPARGACAHEKPRAMQRHVRSKRSAGDASVLRCATLAPKTRVACPPAVAPQPPVARTLHLAVTTLAVVVIIALAVRAAQRALLRHEALQHRLLIFLLILILFLLLVRLLAAVFFALLGRSRVVVAVSSRRRVIVTLRGSARGRRQAGLCV